MSHDRVERACAAGTISRLGRGLYVAHSSTVANPPAGVPTAVAGVLTAVDRARLSTMCAGNPGLVASGRTAAAIWGLALPPSLRPGTGIEVMADADVPGRRGRRHGAVVMRGLTPADHLETGPRGEPTTNPLRTAIDLARGLPLHEALVPLDSALGVAISRLGMPPDVARAILLSHVADLGRTRGIRAVSRAALYAHPGAESALESIVRGRIIDAGLPVPRVQVRVIGASGRTYVADLGMDLRGEESGSCGLLIEADGLGKYADPADLGKEKRREVDLIRRGHQFVRVLYSEAVYGPEPFLDDIASRLGLA